MTTAGDLGAPGDVEEVDLAPQHAAFLRATVEPDDIAAFLGRAFAVVAEVAGSDGARLTGPPVARYSVRQGTFDIQAGFPVDRPLSPVRGVESEELPGGTALRILHVGAYEDVGAAYERADSWLATHHGRRRGDPWECYVDEPDVDEPRTVVYVPFSPGVDDAD